MENQITRIAFAGRMDLAGIQEVERELSKYTALPNVRLLVDLSRVSYLASIGVRALVVSARALRSSAGRMVVFNPQPCVHDVLKLTGTDLLIAIHFELEAALRALIRETTGDSGLSL